MAAHITVTEWLYFFDIRRLVSELSRNTWNPAGLEHQYGKSAKQRFMTKT